MSRQKEEQKEKIGAAPPRRRGGNRSHLRDAPSALIVSPLACRRSMVARKSQPPWRARSLYCSYPGNPVVTQGPDSLGAAAAFPLRLGASPIHVAQCRFALLRPCEIGSQLPILTENTA